jgi:hypothetical protein
MKQGEQGNCARLRKCFVLSYDRVAAGNKKALAAGDLAVVLKHMLRSQLSIETVMTALCIDRLTICDVDLLSAM